MWPLAYGSAAVTRIFRSDIRTLRLTFPLTESKHPQDITIGVKPECRKSRREIAGERQVEFTLPPFHFPRRSRDRHGGGEPSSTSRPALSPQISQIFRGAANDE